MTTSLNITVLTIFPDMFPGPFAHSIAGKALQEGKWQLDVVNIRDFAKDKHQTVDDTPYGGGAGMVMRPDVLADAIDSIEGNPKLYYMSPRGAVLSQPKTQEILAHDHIAIICARYEGIDQRVIDEYQIEELSVGDYILSGGEIAAYVVIDACLRQHSGVIGNPLTLDEESFSDGPYAQLLEYPLFTRPESWRGREIPDVLKSGHHANIDAWRLEQAEVLTKARRPDLWERHSKAKKKVTP